MYSFNPTLVRLALDLPHTAHGNGDRFQSHVGSISTSFPDQVTPPSSVRFNPTLVRLAHNLDDISPKSPTGFNPTLVRLALFVKHDYVRISCRFQSHVGSISTVALGLRLHEVIVFQSHVGSISTAITFTPPAV